jgi:hypothetical protein
MGSNNVYYELKKIDENVVGNRIHCVYTRRNFGKNTILGNILSLVNSVDSNEFEKLKRNGFDINHQFEFNVEVESYEYRKEVEYFDGKEELSVKTSHSVNAHHTLLDLVISSKCNNLKKILLDNGAKVSPDPKYTKYMIAAGSVFALCAIAAIACDQSLSTIIAGTFVAAASLIFSCYSAYKHANPDIEKAEKGPLNSLGNPKVSESEAPQKETLARG